MADRLEEMFHQQEEFMRLLQKERNFPDFPVDLKSKSGQQFIKTIAHECADELCEARQCLKNKPHRATHINEIDREAYLGELVDVQHYLNEIVIASGFTIDEYHEAYMNKGLKNVVRIKSGY